jgi:hypothetical protein
MSEFTDLERAVLHAIFAGMPEIQDALEQQFRGAKVVQRKNSGAGFFTTMAVPESVPAVLTPSPLNTDVHANVAGLDRGMGFLVFVEDGRLETLEGFAYEESTANLDLECLEFEVIRIPVTRL